jgi:arylsulfatase A-like enzyme
VPILHEEASPPVHPYSVSEYHDSRCVRTADWKLIQRGAGIGVLGATTVTAVELYDVRRDPAEENDVATEHPDVVAELSDILRHFVSNMAGDRHAPSAFEEDDVMIERLRGLGYIA